MSDKDKEEIPLEQVVLTQAYALQALINILEKKGLLTRNEVLQELDFIKEIMSNNEGSNH